MDEMSLEDRATITLMWQPACAELVCAHGVLWVTSSGDPRDYLLAPGQRLAIGGRKRVVVSAFGASRLSIHKPRACRESAETAGLGLAGATVNQESGA
ncbi:MAG TPA: DUF2917 domain-containing protein [Spirochaetia bacterium]|nr:DUF2917 domain-containing protein [Spirochaetia bacterium]